MSLVTGKLQSIPPAHPAPPSQPLPQSIRRQRLPVRPLSDLRRHWDWSVQLQALHQIVAALAVADEGLTQLCKASGWHDELLNRARQEAFALRDRMDLYAEPILAAWEAQQG